MRTSRADGTSRASAASTPCAPVPCRAMSAALQRGHTPGTALLVPAVVAHQPARGPRGGRGRRRSRGQRAIHPHDRQSAISEKPRRLARTTAFSPRSGGRVQGRGQRPRHRARPPGCACPRSPPAAAASRPARSGSVRARQRVPGLRARRGAAVDRRRRRRRARGGRRPGGRRSGASRVLLVRGVVLLVHDHQAEARRPARRRRCARPAPRRRRPRARAGARPRARTGVSAECHTAMPLPQPRAQPPQELRRERDLGHQHDAPPARAPGPTRWPAGTPRSCRSRSPRGAGASRRRPSRPRPPPGRAAWSPVSAGGSSGGGAGPPTVSRAPGRRRSAASVDDPGVRHRAAGSPAWCPRGGTAPRRSGARPRPSATRPPPASGRAPAARRGAATAPPAARAGPRGGVPSAQAPSAPRRSAPSAARGQHQAQARGPGGEVVARHPERRARAGPPPRGACPPPRPAGRAGPRASALGPAHHHAEHAPRAERARHEGPGHRGVVQLGGNRVVEDPVEGARLDQGDHLRGGGGHRDSVRRLRPSARRPHGRRRCSPR